MPTLFTLENSPTTRGPIAFTFGAFDGVHLGHQFIFSTLKSEAKKRGQKTACLTFSNHPLELLQPTLPLQLLTSPEQKRALLEALGFDFLLYVPFDNTLRNLSATNFLQNVQSTLPFSLLVVGADARFGKDGQGDKDFILKNNFPFETIFLERFCIDGLPVSSSQVRKAIAEANFPQAQKLLGRPYTIDLKSPTHYCLPPPGRYQVEVKSAQEWKKATAIISSTQQIALQPPTKCATELRF